VDVHVLLGHDVGGSETDIPLTGRHAHPTAHGQLGTGDGVAAAAAFTARIVGAEGQAAGVVRDAPALATALAGAGFGVVGDIEHDVLGGQQQGIALGRHLRALAVDRAAVGDQGQVAARTELAYPRIAAGLALVAVGALAARGAARAGGAGGNDGARGTGAAGRGRRDGLGRGRSRQTERNRARPGRAQRSGAASRPPPRAYLRAAAAAAAPSSGDGWSPAAGREKGAAAARAFGPRPRPLPSRRRASARLSGARGHGPAGIPGGLRRAPALTGFPGAEGDGGGAAAVFQRGGAVSVVTSSASGGLRVRLVGSTRKQ